MLKIYNNRRNTQFLTFTQTQQKAGASHKRKATTFTVADPKFMLDICAKLWYNAFCNCGYSTSASISAFQAEEVGSIPIARSILFRRWFVKNQRLSLCSGPTFGPTFDFCSRKGLYLSASAQRKKAPSDRFGSKGALLLYALYADFLLSLILCKRVRTIFGASRKWSPTFA